MDSSFAYYRILITTELTMRYHAHMFSEDGGKGILSWTVSEHVISTASSEATLAVPVRIKMCIHFLGISYLEIYLTDKFALVCRGANTHTCIGRELVGETKLQHINTVQLLE